MVNDPAIPGAGNAGRNWFVAGMANVLGVFSIKSGALVDIADLQVVGFGCGAFFS